MKWFSITLTALLLLTLASTGKAQQLEPMPYNNPGLVVDLGVGLWAWPLPMDFDGDGDLDLVVNCSDKPYHGIYVFENVSGDTAQNKMPVFKPGRRISKGMQNVQISYVDGEPVVLSPGKVYPDFKKSGLDQAVNVPLPANVHGSRVRANMWRMVDFDGDGVQDIIVGVGDWQDYGWDNAYNEKGEWTNGPLRGYVYVARNAGTNEAPKYDKPYKIMIEDKPLEVFGWPSPNFADFDGDGDLDLICGEFLDGFTYFENVGTRQKPVYAAGRRLKTKTGEQLVMDLQMITPVAIDWDKDGDFDLIVGDEDGRVAFIENTGEFTADGVPVFLEPKYFQQEAEHLKFGALATPVGFDLDGDGDDDIVSGNTAGYICYFENMSGPGVENPKWSAPKLLTVDGKPIRILAGDNGSIQGPAEAKWGYTSLTLADWDGDSLPDLIVNSIWGKVVWYRNLGPRENPVFAPAQPIEVEWEGEQPRLAYGWLRPNGKELLTQWRTTPIAYDWNKDGLVDLIMLDQQGYLAFFERARQGDKLVLLHPRRIFCDQDGNPLQLNAKLAGASGRRKLWLTDWDGDGAIDLFADSENAILYRQVGTKDGKHLFVNEGNMCERNLSGHTTNPTSIDLNSDGIPDLLIGSESGIMYYLRNPQSKAAK